LLNEIGSLFWYFEVRVADIIVKKFTFAISSSSWWVLVEI